MDETTIEKITDEPIVQPKVWIGLALGLAVVGGLVFYTVGSRIDIPKGADGKLPAVAGFVPFVLCVSGMLGGAGIGFLVGEVRQTVKTTTTTKGDGSRKFAPTDVVTKGFEILKDLTPGKTLLVLSVVLIAVTLSTVSPGAPATTVNVEGTIPASP